MKINWDKFNRAVERDMMEFDHPEYRPSHWPFLLHVVEYDDLPQTPRNAAAAVQERDGG